MNTPPLSPTYTTVNRCGPNAEASQSARYTPPRPPVCCLWAGISGGDGGCGDGGGDYVVSEGDGVERAAAVHNPEDSLPATIADDTKDNFAIRMHLEAIQYVVMTVVIVQTKDGVQMDDGVANETHYRRPNRRRPTHLTHTVLGLWLCFILQSIVELLLIRRVDVDVGRRRAEDGQLRLR
ncbi:unnamed protein product [Angiostrongylus costaricensis]|uniref:Uncharacterized protein n=1 Tax=Angiostrongylus costaricensis TaxID=334426 RepID=A0A158PCZ5_ANGCS|nr:unnamed protein product [Angiostrongylus costaricensis]